MRPHDATPAWDREVAVPFRHRVWFTDGALDPANPAFAHALRCACPGRDSPSRMAAFIDSGVLTAWPQLTDQLARYLQAHAGLPELVWVESMPGGEACKNDPSCVEDVLDATEYVTPAIEIIDSRIEQFDRHTRAPRKVFDTISDNAANAAIVLGGRKAAPRELDLPWCGAILRQNGVVEETGLAAGVQGHPAIGVAWLAQKLAPWGERLEAGEIVLAGSFTRPVAAKRGDRFEADYGALGAFSFQFV